MKNIILIIILFSALTNLLNAQARMTEGLRQRLDGKTDFYEIQTEVLEYFSTERAKLSPSDSLGRRLLNRQAKFWNRWLYDCESRLEPDGTPGRDSHFLARPWVTSDATLAGLHLKDPESAQLDTVPTLHGETHGVEHGVNRDLGLDLGDVGDFRDFVDDVDLDHLLERPN